MSKEDLNLSLVPTNGELAVYQTMAQTATKSNLFGKIGGESGILSIMLMARELGVSPMSAIMGGMSVIQGKVEVSPRLMNTMIRKAGHKLEILQSDAKVCRIKGIRSDTKEEYVSEFTMAEAVSAGLVRSGGGWDKFPSDMLFARCISRLGRRLFPDVINNSYVEGEIGTEDLIKQEVVEIKEQCISPEQESELRELMLDDSTLLGRILSKYNLQGISGLKEADFDMVHKGLLMAKKKREEVKNEAN